MYNGVGVPTQEGLRVMATSSPTNSFSNQNLRQFNFHHNRFQPHRDTCGFPQSPSIDIVDHHRKRKIQVKLPELEDKLSEQEYSEFEIAKILAGARN